MRRRGGIAAAWLGCLPLLAQSAADTALPLTQRVAAVGSLPAGKKGDTALCRLASEVAKAAMPDAQRLELLLQLQDAARPRDAFIQGFVALALAYPAFAVGKHDVAIDAALAAAATPGQDDSAKKVRAGGLKFLFQVALSTGDVARAFPHLARYAEVADATTVGIAEVDLLLRVGMVRAAAVALDRLEAAPATAAQRPQIDCLRLQERLANEQFEEARAGAARLLAGPPLGGALGAQVQLTEAFALARLGDGAGAERGLRILLARTDLRPEHATLARAELAMLCLLRGDAPDVAAQELGPDAVAAPGALPDWSLVARARLALARGCAAGSDDELPVLREALRQKHRFVLEQWRATPVQSDGVAFLQWSVRRELLACLCACELALGGVDAATRCLGYLLDADACGSLARRLGASAGDPATLLHRVVPADGILVWFLPAPRGSFAFVAEAGAVRAVPLPGDIPLRGWVRELRQSVRDETVLGADWRPALAARVAPLVAWAFPPALRDLVASHRRITILGRELLTGLPFEFLPSPTDPTQWFGHTHAIDYVPSATLATTTRPAPQPATVRGAARVAVLAATSQSAECAARYPDCSVRIDRSRLAAVAGAIDSASVDVSLEVTGAGLNATLAQADAVVVFAHGRRRHPDDVVEEMQRQRPLGIVLGDGFFGAERLRDVARVPPLVVLASCGTARAGVDRGEDGQLFGTAWLAAGASAVLSAEGDLELQATERLLTAFLAALAAGCDAPEALRRARVAVAADPSFAHPALHCALRLDIRAAAPVQLPAASASRVAWPWFVLGAAFVGAATLLWWRIARARR